MAPRDRLETPDPFPLEGYVQTYGGKVKLTEEDRMARRGLPSYRGSAPGKIDYTQIEVDPELEDMVNRRIEAIVDNQINA